MSAETTTLETKLNKSTLWSNLINMAIAIVLAFSVGYGFFYDTNSTLSDHDEKINRQEKKIEEMERAWNNFSVAMGVVSTELKHVKEDNEKMQKQLEKIDDKLDRLLQK